MDGEKFIYYIYNPPSSKRPKEVSIALPSHLILIAAL